MQRSRLAVEPPPSGVAEEEAVVPRDPALGQFGYTHKEPQLPVAISTGLCVLCVTAPSTLPLSSLAHYSQLHLHHPTGHAWNYKLLQQSDATWRVEKSIEYVWLPPSQTKALIAGHTSPCLLVPLQQDG